MDVGAPTYIRLPVQIEPNGQVCFKIRTLTSATLKMKQITLAWDWSLNAGPLPW